MPSFKHLLRVLSLCLPIAVISALAMFGVHAQPTASATPSGPISTQTMADFESYPAGVNALAAPVVPPLIMLVMSRDEQLFNKAYPDYTALNNDGTLDTTYTDSFPYNGYFDPDLCYRYGSMPVDSTVPTGGQGFYAMAKVSVGEHECASGQQYWSGNFLNWLAMSRLDMLRWTFYGGTRRVDTSTATVLERAEIPTDLHSWAKVYSGTDIANLAPFTGTTTFCNTSGGSSDGITSMPSATNNGDVSDTGKWQTATTERSGVQTVPFIRTASGAWNDWASNAKVQCVNRTGKNDNNNVDSAKPSGAITDYVARVQVCQGGGAPVESFCVAQPSGVSKPEGLLQKYSKNDNSEKHFGLITASAVDARGAGQLRRNVGKLMGNVSGSNCATGTGAGDGDEFDGNTGQFCYKELGQAPAEGIVYTLDRLQISGWKYQSSGPDGGYYDYGDSGAGCYGPSNPWGARGYQLVATPSMCPDFGNPLAAMYATALQYVQGQRTPTGADSSGPLPNPKWVDPYGTPAGSDTQRNPKCAACSIVLVSSGLNTFDGAGAQTLPTVDNLQNSVTGLTDEVASGEGLSGNYLLSINYTDANSASNPRLTVGGADSSDVAACASAPFSNLGSIVGICNGAPGQQGGYLLSGLSYGAWDASGQSPIRNDDKVIDKFQVATYGVALADNLPSFTIKTGSGAITLSPSCRSTPNNPGDFTSCYLGSVQIGAQYTYGSTTHDGKNTYGLVPTTQDPDVGSYYFVWEDSQYGSDHDQDVNNIISYCVGDSCNMPSKVRSGGVAICDPVIFNGKTGNIGNTVYGDTCNSNGQLKFTPGPDDVVIRNQVTAYSSSFMYVGYEVSGSGSDGLYETYISNGGQTKSINQNGAVFNCNLLGGSSDCKSAPVVQHFTLGGSSPVSPLQTPLWLAARYSDYTGATPPALTAGQDPDNYFFARNAGDLKNELDEVFHEITSSGANNFGNATTPSSSNDVQGNGLSYQVQYYQQRNEVDWTGSLQAFWSDAEGDQREGTVDSNGNEVLSSDASYVVSGPDTSSGALPGAVTSYICPSTVPPVPPAGETSFDPSASGCTITSADYPLQPVWDASTLLDAYYDPAAEAGTDDADAIANLAVQRDYAADASAAGNIGQRYIFTYLTDTPDGTAGTGTVMDGTQTDFVWNADWKNPSSCDSSATEALTSTSGFWGCYDATDGTRVGNYGLLNEKDPALAQELVNWVRGVDSPACSTTNPLTADYRCRTPSPQTSDSPPPTVTYRLGDIVDSSPVIVGTPAESYDLLYSDFSYAAFRANYRNRRQMIYVGANDGMLHAFNGGFYVTGQATGDPSTATNPTDYRQLPRTLNGSPSGLTTGSPVTAAAQGNDWALGQEAWAFIPQNLLPHLRWMADKNYTHVFYVDGTPVVTDAQVFGSGSSSTCQAGSPGAGDIDIKGHVCGWGTVMAVPFRLGGGPISVDTVKDGTDSDAATDTQTSNSAYVILDITDPEQPPTVLGEITTGTYTTGAPAFSVHCETTGDATAPSCPGGSGKLHFLLTLGSGPGDNGGPLATTGSTGTGTSGDGSNGSKPVSAPAGEQLKVWVYDLAQVVAGDSDPVAFLKPATTSAPAYPSFAGDMVASDFNLNDSAEGVYFGIVTNPPPPSTPPAAPVPQVYGGGLWKLDMNTGPVTSPDTSDPGSWVLKQVIDTDQPVTIRPTVALDSTSRPMIYFGTGRSYTTDDNSGISAQGTQQQYIYAVSDNSLLAASACQTMPTTSGLFDASEVDVAAGGAVSGLGGGSTAPTTLGSLEAALTSTAATGTNAGCYRYSGWKLALAAGNANSNAQQPSERVISSQTLLGGILLTPTYIPPNAAQITDAGSTACNSAPVPGTSNLYGLDYLTGTASPGLASSFGGTSSAIARSIPLGSGIASSPVLHVAGGNVTAAFGISGGTRLQSIGSLGNAYTGEISWREPVDNQ